MSDDVSQDNSISKKQSKKTSNYEQTTIKAIETKKSKKPKKIRPSERQRVVNLTLSESRKFIWRYDLKVQVLECGNRENGLDMLRTALL